MKRKHLQALIGVTAGVAIAATEDLGTYAVALQMAFYSVAVFALLALGFWEEHRSTGFWIRAALTFALHFVFLYLGRGLFPLRSVVMLVLITLIESLCLAAILVLRLPTNG